MAQLNDTTINGKLSTHAAVYNQEIANAITAGAATIDWRQGNKQSLALDQSVTLTFVAPDGPCNLVLRIIHDATAGEYSVTYPASVLVPGGAAPVLTAAAGAVDLLAIYFDGANYLVTGASDFKAVT